MDQDLSYSGRLSTSSVGRFLKSGGFETASDEVLADRQGRGRSRLPTRGQTRL